MTDQFVTPLDIGFATLLIYSALFGTNIVVDLLNNFFLLLNSQIPPERYRKLKRLHEEMK